MDGDVFNTASSGGADPLAQWMQQIDGDPGLHMLMVTDPQKAAQVMAQRGIMPPPDASAYNDPTSGTVFPDDTPWPGNAPIRTNPDGTVAGNLTAPADPVQKPTAVAAAPAPAPTGPLPTQTASAGTDLDPANDQPTSPQSDSGSANDTGKTETKAGNKGQDWSGNSFAKSLEGVKALAPPPLNPVGTPSVRSPTAAGAPNIASLLQLAGIQQAPPSALSTLGRLLVAGKA